MSQSDYNIVDVLAETNTNKPSSSEPQYNDEAFASWLMGKVTTEQPESTPELENTDPDIEADLDANAQTADEFIQMINAASRD